MELSKGFLRIKLVFIDEDMLGNCCDELFWLKCADRFGVGIFYEDSDEEIKLFGFTIKYIRNSRSFSI